MKNLIIVAAPSGAGKSTLCKAIIKSMEGIRTSVSHTTRKPRGHEEDGEAYHFVDKNEFESLIEKGFFVEWTQIHGNYYGTSHKELAMAESGDLDIILEIEGHGALQIKGKFPHAITLFILPPSMAELEARLVNRSEDEPEEIQRRMKNAYAEIQYVEQFEYIVINDDFDQALEKFKTIITAGRLKTRLTWPEIADRFRG